MNEHHIIPTLYRWEALDYKSHTLPCALGMWIGELECLLWCALNSPPGDWLEIGSFKGGSFTALGLAREEAGLDPTVFACDIKFDPMVEQGIINAGIGYLIQKIECNSQALNIRPELQDRKISFAFIDGWHSYNGVLQDVHAISSYLTKNAIIAFHDVSPMSYGDEALLYFKSIKPTKEKHQKLMSDFTENFRLDEAVATLLGTGNFELVEIPIRKYEQHYKETSLKEWVRGTTSPYNSFCAIRKVK
jgi:predicted O-methyltransferase YrrM